jgi:RNA polymerase sigma factor (sigma-70 family)
MNLERATPLLVLGLLAFLVFLPVAQAGANEEALVKLINDNYQALLAYLLKRTGNWHDAEEVAQNVIMQLVVKLDNGPPDFFVVKLDKESPDYFRERVLFRAGMEEIAAFWRRKNAARRNGGEKKKKGEKGKDPLPIHEFEGPPDYRSDPAKIVEQLENETIFRDFVREHCSAIEYEVLDLKAKDFTCAEMAGEFDISVKTCETRLRRARIKLGELESQLKEMLIHR